jgi:hypothetical protein
MIVFGGSSASALNDVWALSLNGSPAWSQLFPSGVPPSARGGHSAIYDPVRDRMIVFGGPSGMAATNEVWVLSLSGTPTWSQLTLAGAAPPGRSAHTAVYDPVSDRMVIFGGTIESNRFNDVWALSLGDTPTWTNLLPAGTPPSARYGAKALFDPVRNRMVVFGGEAEFFTNEVWALSLGPTAAWTQLTPAGGPPARRLHPSVAYDQSWDRMVVFGGYASDGNRQRDIWSLHWGNIPTLVHLPPISAVMRAPITVAPNPSSGGARIEYSVANEAPVRIGIVDVAGREVAVIVRGIIAPGRHSAVWDGRARGAAVPAGVYFVVWESAGARMHQRLVVVR